MIQLTDEFIKSSFEKLGLDEKFFPFFDKEVREAYDVYQQDIPDDEETTEESLEEDKRDFSILLDIESKRTVIFANEIEKGHSEKWAISYARDFISGEDEFVIIEEAYKSIEDKDQRERELDIYVNSLSDDPIFRERYKYLFHEYDENVLRKASEYTEAYHSCIQNGKSDIYAHAFADKKNNYIDENDKHYYEHVADIFAEAYEQAIKRNMDEWQAFIFGNDIIDICTDDDWLMPHYFIKHYQEDWQKELYLYLANKDYKFKYEKDMPLDDIEHIKYSFNKGF